MAKTYNCPYNDCQKQYGSEGSLNLHMKIKHKAGSKTDRERLAKNLIQAYQNGGPTNSGDGKHTKLAALESINMPPGIIQETAKKLGVEVPEALIGATNE